MPTELISHRRQDLRSVALRLPTDEAHEKRGGDDRCRHVEIDGFGHGPAPLTAVRHSTFDTAEAGVLFESVGRQVQEPGSHDAAVAPELGDLV